jgi:hypothetical protein
MLLMGTQTPPDSTSPVAHCMAVLADVARVTPLEESGMVNGKVDSAYTEPTVAICRAMPASAADFFATSVAKRAPGEKAAHPPPPPVKP